MVHCSIARRLLDCLRTVAPSLTIGLEMPDGWYLDRIGPHLQDRIDAGLVERMPTVCNVEHVRRAADVITASNTDDGWAAAIERYVFADRDTI